VGNDVQVTIGANATPYQVAMAKVKVTAQETASTIGIEFDRGAARAEQRVQRGMEGVIRSILSAKSPIEAVGEAIEGLSRAFGIASSAFLAIGIGVAIYEQFTKAKEAADDLAKSMEKLGSVNVENESIHQLQRDIDDFEKVQEKYNDRGLLERILFGNKEDVDFAQAANLNGLKKDLVETRQLQDDLTKAQARTLEASSNPEDQAKGKQMLKGLSDKGENEDLQDKLDQAQKELFDAKQASNKQQFLASAPTSQWTSEERKFMAKNSEIDLSIPVAAAQSKIDQIKAVQAAVKTAEEAEKPKAEKPDSEAAAKREADRVRTETERAAKIKQDSAEVGMTGEQKAAEIRAKIAAEQKADANEIGPKQQSQQLAEQNTILEDQLALKKQIADNDKEAASKAAEATRKADEKKKQLDDAKGRRAKLLQDLSGAQSEVATAQANAMGFHGTVSSLRKEGFGRTPSGGGKEGAAQKAAAASEKHLADIKTEIAALNAKIGGGA
jgi:hypothetical protein